MFPFNIKPPQKTTVPFIGQENIEHRVDGIFKFFGRKLFSGHEVQLSEICNFLSDKMKTNFVFEEDLGCDHSGFEILGKFNLSPPQISVSNHLEKNSPRWRFTLAHEIGHFLYHRYLYKVQPEMNRADTDSSISWGRDTRNNQLFRLEWQANSFASSLLLPRDKIVLSVVDGLKECDISRFTQGVIYLDNQRGNVMTYKHILHKIRREYNVSLQAINYRLVQLRLVNNQSNNKKITDLVDKTLAGIIK